jgi:hypothetical protein
MTYGKGGGGGKIIRRIVKIPVRCTVTFSYVVPAPVQWLRLGFDPPGVLHIFL